MVQSKCQEYPYCTSLRHDEIGTGNVSLSTLIAVGRSRAETREFSATRVCLLVECNYHAARNEPSITASDMLFIKLANEHQHILSTRQQRTDLISGISKEWPDSQWSIIPDAPLHE